MQTVRLFQTAFSLSLRRSFAYRIDFGFDALLAFLQLGASVATIGIVFTHTGLLAGWSGPEMLILVGTYSVITGLRSTFFDPGLDDLADQIRDGRLDNYLLQPASSVVLPTSARHAPLALVQSGLGIIVTLIGARHLGHTPSLVGFAAWAMLSMIGLITGWAILVGLASLAFWAPRLSLGVLHEAAWGFARYPVDIYGRWLKQLFTYAFPIAVMTTWPAEALTIGPNLIRFAAATLIAAAFVAIAMIGWRAGLHRYTGATS